MLKNSFESAVDGTFEAVDGTFEAVFQHLKAELLISKVVY